MRTLADQDPIHGRTDMLAPLTSAEAAMLREKFNSAWAKNFQAGYRAMRSDLSALLLDTTRQMRAGA